MGDLKLHLGINWIYVALAHSGHLPNMLMNNGLFDDSTQNIALALTEILDIEYLTKKRTT
jgi:hypothetical protein